MLLNKKVYGKRFRGGGKHIYFLHDLSYNCIKEITMHALKAWTPFFSEMKQHPN